MCYLLKLVSTLILSLGPMSTQDSSGEIVPYPSLYPRTSTDSVAGIHRTINSLANGSTCRRVGRLGRLDSAKTDE